MTDTKQYKQLTDDMIRPVFFPIPHGSWACRIGAEDPSSADLFVYSCDFARDENEKSFYYFCVAKASKMEQERLGCDPHHLT